MVEKFGKKAAEKKIKDIKNNDINPYRDTMKPGAKENAMTKKTIAAKASQGYNKALKIEKDAKNAGINLGKDAMRRLEKIKVRFNEAINKDEFNQKQTNRAYNNNQQNAADFRSGVTAANKKERRER